jgi:hypothetical protein
MVKKRFLGKEKVVEVMAKNSRVYRDANKEMLTIPRWVKRVHLPQLDLPIHSPAFRSPGNRGMFNPPNFQFTSLTALQKSRVQVLRSFNP